MRINDVSSGTYINFMQIKYEDDTEDTIMEQTNSSGDLITKEFPQGHMICGMYGHTGDVKDYQRMHAVGFILERTPE